MKTIYEQIYEKLIHLIPDLLTLKSGNYMKSKSAGYMDLSLDVLSSNDDRIIIALAHNYELNGDLVPDPDMEIRVFKNLKLAEAMTYQDARTYECVYDNENNADKKLQRDLDLFLYAWITQCIDQGHKLICAS